MSRLSDVAEHSSEDKNGELTGNNDGLLENSKIKVNNKLTESELSALNDHPSGNNKPKGKAAVFSQLFKRTKTWTRLPAKEEELSLQHGELSAGNHNKTQNNNTMEEPALKNDDFSGSDNLEENSLFNFLKTSPGGPEDTSDEDSPPLHIKLLACNDNLLYLSNNNLKDNSGKQSGTFRSSPKPALRFPAETDPLSEHSEFTDWDYNFLDTGIEKKSAPRKCHDKKLSNSNNKLVSFRVKRTLPRMPTFSSSTQDSDQEDMIEEPMEMQQLGTTEDCTFEILPLEMAAYPTDLNFLETDEDDDLMDWWKTVEGWSEWNETANFQEDDEERAVEAAADRVFMAARLFVSLFNQRGVSLQHHILELLALADTADNFHKKTVSAAVGGGVASVAGGIATITGLILAPFTFGTSTIVTAVGISVATAGSITSATANITDAVQSKMDRKKVEKMIQGYQNEISDIRDCLEFMQEGMNTLQEWDFKGYSESVVNTSLSRNIKHVMKEGGRAGKALMINTDRLINTVKVLGVAGGAAKAARAVSITTGVMSTLFLALDVFFLAKNSNELHKGAKTKFASKIREVCEELQHGLLELNKVKTQLQKTMDGIEVEEYEEEEEDEEVKSQGGENEEEEGEEEEGEHEEGEDDGDSINGDDS
uniref:Si:rp71-1g18.13 n=1 Tax=Cyprinus carpio TaxID=7962 RepID=A0A8C2AIC3_CYPCA